MLKFCPIASGSNGNCVFVSDGETKILIDAGLSGRTIESGLAAIGESCKGLNALFVTHEHSDHISGAGVISRRHGVPIYATEGTWAYINKYKAAGKLAEENRQYIYAGGETRVGGFAVRPFTIPHDAAEPVAFAIYAEGRKICVATDMGHVTDDILDYLAGAEILLAESNHDENMLMNGRYSYPLKMRIIGARGHLSNANCGELIRAVYSDKLRSVYLGHLSAENNTPELAYGTVLNILNAYDIPVNEAFELKLARRGAVSAPAVLGNPA